MKIPLRSPQLVGSGAAEGVPFFVAGKIGGFFHMCKLGRLANWVSNWVISSNIPHFIIVGYTPFTNHLPYDHQQQNGPLSR